MLTLEETFATPARLDTAVSGGTWSSGARPAAIGGDGRHGSFDPTIGTTITTGIYTAVGTYTSDFGQIFAMMFLSALPMLAFFFALQREFIAGLTSGALKG